MYTFNTWVPHKFTAENKNKEEAVCLTLLRDQKKEKIIDRIVTCGYKIGVIQQYKL